MSISQKLVPVAVLLSAIALTSCGKTLDHVKIETQIKEAITKEGGSSLKSVICPMDIKPEAGRVFECIGVLDSKAGFAIAVKQQDDQGNVVWDVQSVKGLLNMAKLQDEFAQGLKKEIGEARVDCSSSIYRAAKPGETFECKLLKREDKSPVKVIGKVSDQKSEQKSDATKPTKPSTDQSKPKEEDFIQVTIQPSGDINWQRIIKVPATQLAAADPKEIAKKDPKSKDSKASKENEPAQKGDAPAAAKSAEDFLNQPGASDNFD
jgi:Domain of unknown function (DUF4333)